MHLDLKIMTAKTAKKTTSKPKTVRVAKLPELPRMPFVFEVFDLASKQRTKAKKVEVLQKYAELSIKQFFLGIIVFGLDSDHFYDYEE